MFEKESFGDRITTRRKELGLSRKAVADSLYVSKDTYIKWEQGKNTPKIQDLIALAEIFNISVGYLVGIEEESNNMRTSEVLENQISAFIIEQFNEIEVDQNGISVIESEAEVYVGEKRVAVAWKQYLMEEQMKLKSRRVRDRQNGIETELLKNSETPYAIEFFVTRSTFEPVMIRNYGKRIISDSWLMRAFDLLKISVKEFINSKTEIDSYIDNAKEVYEKELSVAKKEKPENKNMLIPVHVKLRSAQLMYCPEENKYYNMMGYSSCSLEGNYVIIEAGLFFYSKTDKSELCKYKRNNEDYYIYQPTSKYLKIFDCADYPIAIVIAELIKSRKMEKYTRFTKEQFIKIYKNAIADTGRKLGMVPNAYETYSYGLEITNEFRENPTARQRIPTWESEMNRPYVSSAFWQLDLSLAIITEFLMHPLELIDLDQVERELFNITKVLEMQLQPWS